MHRRRLLALLLRSTAITAPLVSLHAQDQAPNRRDLTLTVAATRFEPTQLEAVQDDLVRITIHSDDTAHNLMFYSDQAAGGGPAGVELSDGQRTLLGRSPVLQ